MARKFVQSEIINRPVAEVFAFLSNFENNAQWEPSVLEAHQVSSEPMQVGTKLSEIRKFMGRQVASNYEVIGYETNRKFAVQSVSGPIQVKASYTFEPTESGTKITDTAEFEIHGFFKLMAPLFGMMVRNQMESNFRKIKEIFERSNN